VSALHGRPLTVYGSGEQTRSFCYIDDLVEGLVRMMQTDDSVTGPINLGNPGEFTIADLAHLVLEQTRSNSQLQHLPLPPDDPVRRQPDITRATQMLDWVPTVSLEAGLEPTIHYFKTLAQG